MEILINGRALKDPAFTAPAAFAQIMTEIVRILGKREEIVTDVHADGREVESWDTAKLDVSKIARLEIRSQPAREYAITSLGDLGEYTGQVLSVLRNVENICKKDGFDTVRRKLCEGLDYILTVIETTGSVLKFDLAQSRYDIRSGEQMLKELRSLKTRLAESPNLESSRSHFENLEFTLTDWLKFLETLLRRYSDKQAELGTPEDVSDQARSQIDAMDRLQTDIKSIVEDLYAGKVAKSLDQFQTRILALQSSLVYLQQLKEGGRIQYHSLAVKEESLSEKIPQMTKILKELSDSIQIGDTVLMRDLLEYEVLPFIQFIRQIYEQICTSDDSSKLS